jgi:hypothetical protein
MNLIFKQWLEYQRYTHWDTTCDSRIWVVNNIGGSWKWKQIIDYESKF